MSYLVLCSRTSDRVRGPYPRISYINRRERNRSLRKEDISRPAGLALLHTDHLGRDWKGRSLGSVPAARVLVLHPQRSDPLASCTALTSSAVNGITEGSVRLTHRH